MLALFVHRPVLCWSFERRALGSRSSSSVRALNPNIRRGVGQIKMSVFSFEIRRNGNEVLKPNRKASG
ncbi:hypothetical protein Mp_2g12590 [Marchantia polymorpha subsp. ruderalis]|uniref:Uncharacterized protein n=1 Tax=Marchantia polymorpha TaxID=3197 RepID=A0A2R6XAU8_MARPO|nr:hypothetical protein MARPO_0026s0112 [Marchantia polymorpha]BBN02082.1 hypothetical protein Mp_2g12590 [Marchantia polymorpha subsp. ruderalis]|eukprot:PTQ43240.1 hypothetical protein MARPO_0026s0112 [Marchantia polymorpha]